MSNLDDPDPSNMSEPAYVVVVGSYNHDHLWRVDRFPRPGETRLGRSFQVGAGGKGFNQAIASHRQGGNTLFIGAIGDDALGVSAQHIASEAGLPCRWQICADHPTAATCVLVDDDGHNEIVVNAAANLALSADYVGAQTDAFTAGNVLLVQMETGLDVIRAALHQAHAAGMTCILNPAPVHAQCDAALLAACDIVTPNETEFAQLLVQCADRNVDAEQLASMDDVTLHALSRALGVPTVIITLGAHGCFVSHSDVGDRCGDKATYYRVAAEHVKTIDTTGAGDAFNGALAAMLLRLAGQPLRTMVVHANRAAALSTERVGAAIAMVDAAAVHQRFGKSP
ncbi:MAG: ribokinase [Xanthomonadales bacterium]|nr:ribokinase [Xanthomonadales bacterium]